MVVDRATSETPTTAAPAVPPQRTAGGCTRALASSSGSGASFGFGEATDSGPGARPFPGARRPRPAHRPVRWSSMRLMRLFPRSRTTPYPDVVARSQAFVAAVGPLQYGRRQMVAKGNYLGPQGAPRGDTAMTTADAAGTADLTAIHTLADVIRVHASRRPDAPALDIAGRTVTFGELDARSNQVAQALRAAGVERRGPGRLHRQERPRVVRGDLRPGQARRGQRVGQLAAGARRRWRRSSPTPRPRS